MTQVVRQLVITLKACEEGNGIECLSAADRNDWLQGKHIALVHNERYLDLEEAESSSYLKREIYNLLDFDGAYSQSVRQAVVERARFTWFKVNTIDKIEHRIALHNSKYQ